MTAMILVTGASGTVGGEAARRLSATGVPVRVLVRNLERAQELATLPNVEIVTGDMGQPDSLGPALAGIDRALLISSSVPAMEEVQNSFIDAAVRAGVRHVVKLSGIIPDVESPFRFGRMHGAIEQHLERSGMAWTHIRAGEFMHSYFRQVPSIVNRGILALPMADQRIASIDVGDIAEVAAITLTQPGHEGMTYPITGPESLSMAEIAVKLSRVVGKPIRYVAVDPAEAKGVQLAAGVPPYLVDALAELFAERRKGKEATVSPVIPDVFGWRPTSFDEFADRYAAIFRGEETPPRV